MEYKIENNNIFCLENGGVIGHLTMVLENGKLVITQTFVNEEYRGKGIASKLVDMAIEHANEKQTELIATCSFAKKYLESNKNSV